MLHETEVLVVGAGPTGLTLATLLQRAGLPCLIIDKAGGPSVTSKAIGLQYRVSEILAWMGLVDRFIARAAKQSAVNLVVEGRVAARLMLGELRDRTGAGGFVPRPLILPQSETEAILGDALREAGGHVAWQHELCAFRDDGQHVHATLADGSVVKARYLVSCEGAHSVARRAANIAFEGKTYPHDFIMADVAIANTHRANEAYSYLHPRGVLSAIALPGEQRWRLFIEAGDTHVDEVTLEAVRALYVERTGDGSAVISDPSWLTRFKIHSRIVERFSSGRVFLAGDAAHLHSPSGGQGITTGMQDATNLAWKLIHVLRHGAPEALLDTYDEERRPAAKAVLAKTDVNTRRLFAQGAFSKWFRNRVFIPLLGTALLQRRLIGKLSQLDESYRAAALARSVPRCTRSGLQAGARAPDVTFDAAGKPHSLFELLRDGRFVALLGHEQLEFAARLEQLGVRVQFIGADPEVRKLYGKGRADVWLIRPDGYVLLHCSLTQRDQLQRVLEQLWSPSAVRLAFDHKAPHPDAAAANLHPPVSCS